MNMTSNRFLGQLDEGSIERTSVQQEDQLDWGRCLRSRWNVRKGNPSHVAEI